MTANLSPNSTVNPRNSKTKVDDKEGAGQPTTIPMKGTGQESQKGAGFIGGSKSKASAKKSINETVNPSSDSQVLSIVDSDQVEVSAGINHGNDHIEVLDHKDRSPNQTVVREMGQGNGTVISGFASTVNPSLGDVYKLQFRDIQEAVETREIDTEVLKEATRKSVEDLAPIGRNMEAGQSNNDIQLVDAVIDDLGILARKTFNVTSGILAKGFLLNNKGQRELGMIAKKS